MTIFNVYQQMKMKDDNSVLEPRGVIAADTPEQAIAEAKQLPAFKQGKKLGKFPIVEEV